MHLDGKSARKIATGRLITKESEIEEAITVAMKMPRRKLGKAGKAGQRVLEDTVKRVYGDTLIGSGWISRTFIFSLFEVKKFDDGRPLQMVIKGFSANTRSARQQSTTVAVITMHAMERLMERREEVDLVRIAKEEFDVHFVHRMVDGVLKAKLPANAEFDVRTHSGSARGIIGNDGIPVVRTWIRSRTGEE